MNFKVLTVFCLGALHGATFVTTQTCDEIDTIVRESEKDWAQEEKLWLYLIANGYNTTPEQPGGLFFSEIPLTDELEIIYRKSDLVLKISENLAENLYANSLPQYANLNPELAKSSTCLTNDFFKPFCAVSESYSCSRNFKYRSFDGFCNDPDRPKDGAAGTAFDSFAYQYYHDSIKTFRRSYQSNNLLPHSRELVNTFFNQCLKRDVYLEYAPSLVGIMFGQIMAHDVSLKPFPQRKPGGPDLQCCKADFSGPLPENLRHPICEPQVIPENDMFFGPKNMRCMNFLRTQGAFDNECILSSKKQLNLQTSALDLSSVYGTSYELVKTLRTGEKGLLKLGGNKVFPVDAEGDYIFTDFRTNQTPILALMHSVYLREHNRLAKKMWALNPNWDDETLFQEARRWNIAQYQHVVCKWNRVFLDHKFSKLRLKEPGNPVITTTNEFAHSVFRHLHTILPQKFEYYDENGVKTDEVCLSDTFGKPFVYLDSPAQYNGLTRGLFYQKTNFNGCLNEVINRLFKNSDDIGIDLISMDISRTDDHGVQQYYVYAKMCLDKDIKNFNDLGPEISDENIELLKRIYGSVFDVHLYIGSKLETAPNEYKFGPTISCLYNAQFYRYTQADPYYYNSKNNINPFTSEQLRELQKASYERLLCDNTDIKKVAKNSFYAVSESNPVVPCSQIEKVDIVF